MDQRSIEVESLGVRGRHRTGCIVCPSTHTEGPSVDGTSYRDYRSSNFHLTYDVYQIPYGVSSLFRLDGMVPHVTSWGFPFV